MAPRTRVALLAATLSSAIILGGCSALPKPPSSATPTTAPATPTAQAAQGTPIPGGVEVALAAIDWPQRAVVARVNGVEIKTEVWREEVTRQLRLVTSQYQVDWNDQANIDRLPLVLDPVLDNMIDVELLRQIAANEKITVTDADVQQETQATEQQIVSGGQYADLNAFLKANELTPDAFNALMRDQVMANRLVTAHGGPAEVEQIHARHILVADEAKAQEVLNKLAAGEKFEDLAKTYSIDTGNKDQGGDLGWFPRGVMLPEFDEAAFALQKGQRTTAPVKTQYGYHIIQVDERGVRKMEEPILSQVQQQTFLQWLDAQRKAANIERLYTAATPTPEVTRTP